MPEKTRLHVAALSAGDALQKLLQNGDDPNVVDEAGRTPLHNACEQVPQHVPLLLAAGAAPNAKDHRGLTPLHYAAVFNRGACAPLLQASVDLNAQDSSGHTPLFHAVALGRVEAVRELLQAGADPGVPDFTGETLFAHIHLSLGPGTTDTLWTVDAMLHGPARIGAHLQSLIYEGNAVRIARVLNPREQPGYYWCRPDLGPLPLSDWNGLAASLSAYCTERSAWRCLHVLTDCGLPTLLPDAMRSRQLHPAALENVPAGQAPVALIQAATEDGLRIPLLLELHAAECLPALDAALFTICSISQPGSPSAQSALREALRSLLRAGASLDARSDQAAKDLHRALHQPVADDNTMLWQSFPRFLSFPGAMMRLSRPLAFTPLLQAAEHCSPLLEDLILAGANAHATDRFGRNALHLAAASPNAGNATSAIAVLLNAGLAVDAPTPAGLRALTLATNPDTVGFLLHHQASPHLTDAERQRLGATSAIQLQQWIDAARHA